MALKQLHNGRSGALLGYTAEFLWYAQLPPDENYPTPDHVLAPALTALFSTAFATVTIPYTWQTSPVTPIYSRGVKTQLGTFSVSIMHVQTGSRVTLHATQEVPWVGQRWYIYL